MLERRRNNRGSGLAAQAFGAKAGSDPTPNPWDGHAGWAKNLRVPPVVARTVHLIAMNEIRNSFPLDTIWDGTSLPIQTETRLSTQAHSNAGGGATPVGGDLPSEASARHKTSRVKDVRRSGAGRCALAVTDIASNQAGSLGQ